MFKKSTITYGDEKWDSNGDHAQLLSHLFKTGVIGKDWPATKICERYPQFTIYPQANFRATVYRYKHKYFTGVTPEVTPTITISDSNNDNGAISNRSTNAHPIDEFNNNSNNNNISNDNRNDNYNDNFNEMEDNYFEALDSDYEEACETIASTKYVPRKNDDGIDLKEDGTPINFRSTTNEFSLGYEVLQWKVPQENSGWISHITVNVHLPKLLNSKDCATYVSSCGYKLIVTLKLPKILDLPMIDTRNAKLYKDKNTGEPLYPPMHVRSVAHKSALRTLQRNDEGNVELKQVIWLPCKVRANPVELNDYPGIIIKVLDHNLYVLVVELISADSKPTRGRRQYAPSVYDECTIASRGAKTNATTRSVFSINYDTGMKNNKCNFPPTHVETPVQMYSGMSNTENNNPPLEKVYNFDIPPNVQQQFNVPVFQSQQKPPPKSQPYEYIVPNQHKQPPQSQPYEYSVQVQTQPNPSQLHPCDYNIPNLPPLGFAYLPHKFGTTLTENIVHLPDGTEWTSRKRQRTMEHEVTQQSIPQDGTGVFFDDEITVNSTEQYSKFGRTYYR